MLKFWLPQISESLHHALFYSEKSVIAPAIPGPIQLFGFMGPGTTGMEGVTSNGSTYPSWTGPRADWRAILSSLINARVMDSVGFKPACSCWRHNRQDTTTLATLDTITMLQLATLSLVLRGLSLSFLSLPSLSWTNLRYPLIVQHSQKRRSRRVKVMVTYLNISHVWYRCDVTKWKEIWRQTWYISDFLATILNKSAFS